VPLEIPNERRCIFNLTLTDTKGGPLLEENVAYKRLRRLMENPFREINWSEKRGLEFFVDLDEDDTDLECNDLTDRTGGELGLASEDNSFKSTELKEPESEQKTSEAVPKVLKLPA